MNAGPNDTLELTPQEIDEWRLERDVAAMSRHRYADALPQAVNVLAGTPQPPRYNRATDMRSLPGGGLVRQRHQIFA